MQGICDIYISPIRSSHKKIRVFLEICNISKNTLIFCVNYNPVTVTPWLARHRYTSAVRWVAWA